MPRNSHPPDTFPCPHCGSPVPVGRPSCPHCGADEETGWAADADTADLPSGYARDDDFDYNEFVAREFGPAAGHPRRHRRLWWLVALAAALLAILLLLAVR